MSDPLGAAARSADFEPRLIQRQEEWLAIADAVGAARVLAADLEADGFHRYPEQVCLIQLGLPGGEIYLLDTLALDDLSALDDALNDPSSLKIFHSASYDVRSLDRDFGYHIRGLYDTAIAAQFCGAERTGLANVLEEWLEVELPKSKRLQRMDWSRRPLPEDALAYAAGDVLHLHALAELLDARLAQLGRQAWVVEECERLEAVRHEPTPPPEEAFLNVKGARELTPRGRAVLREIFVFRDEEALTLRRPPHYVMSNKALIELAGAPDKNLADIRGISRRTLHSRRRSLEQAILRGKQSPPVKWPRRGGPSPWTPEARERLSELKGWRNAQAERLGLGAGVVWSAKHLDQLALRPEAPLSSLDQGDPPWVRRWQWDELGETLDAFRRERFGG